MKPENELSPEEVEARLKLFNLQDDPRVKRMKSWLNRSWKSLSGVRKRDPKRRIQ